MPISQDEAFKIPPWIDDTTEVKVLYNEARLWYETKGYSLTTRLLAEYTGHNPPLSDVIPSKPDDNLIRLYVVSIADPRRINSVQGMGYQMSSVLAARDVCVEKVRHSIFPPTYAVHRVSAHDPAQTLSQEIASMCGPCPALYEPAFAWASKALADPSSVDEELETGSGFQDKPDACGASNFDVFVVVNELRQRLNDVQHTVEDTRRSDVHALLKYLLDDRSLEKWRDFHTVDGKRIAENYIVGYCETPHKIKAPYFVWEDKVNRACLPAVHVHTPYAYRRMIALHDFTSIREISSCPCLIGGIVGSSLVFLAAYFTDRVYCSRLCTIDLYGSPHQAHEDLEIARKLQIMRITARRLRESYMEILVGELVLNAPHVFPRPIFRPIASSGLGGQSPPEFLKFTDRIKPFDGHRMLFTGQLIEPSSDGPVADVRDVYIKFVENYGIEAHRLLAEQHPPLAPRIIFYGEVDCHYDGLKMIVMEGLSGSPLSEYKLVHPDSKFDVDAHVKAPLQRALKVLHDHSIVHGDIRSPNVFIVQEPEFGTLQLRLIDFDWAAKEGTAEARYPEILNTELTWAAGVAPRAWMRREHDTEMAERLVNEMKELWPLPATTPSEAGAPQASALQKRERSVDTEEERDENVKNPRLETQP
ncbi:hypothetical protein C8Q76DRAFT_799095 [Earliella scabrosa]|nr:hypothetical protein C8Q76DRAFT_799095 [Earliella scabrosa]